MDFMHRAAAWLAGGVVFAASCASVLAAAACLPTIRTSSISTKR